MNIFKLQFPDMREGLPIKKPSEDYVSFKDNIFSVADGVTLWKIPYPDPSPALEVAKICCNSIVSFINKNISIIDSNQILFKAISFANDNIRDFNTKNNVSPETVDYLDYQYASTVCSAGLIKNNILYFANINDCGVKIFNDKNEVIEDLIADTQFHEEYLNYLRSLKIYTTPKEEHIYFRKNAVNKHIIFKNKELNFGVLTGESQATDFIKTGKTKVSKNYKAIFYTDGFEPHMKSKEFSQKLLNLKDLNEHNLKQYIEDFSKNDPKYQKEKSIIIVYI